MNLDGLRTVCDAHEVNAQFDRDASLIVAGEQVRKKRTANGRNLVTWGDIVRDGKIEFASFIPPGRYSVQHPWHNEYWRLANFDKAILHNVKSPATDSKKLQEIELVFSTQEGNPQRFIVGGFDLHDLPQLPTSDYPKGMYMPMGIGVSPFYQSYAALQANPPQESPFYSLLLDADNHTLSSWTSPSTVAERTFEDHQPAVQVLRWQGSGRPSRIPNGG
jgi:hypothetical protein